MEPFATAARLPLGASINFGRNGGTKVLAQENHPQDPGAEKPTGTHTQWYPGRLHLCAGAYAIFQLHVWRGKGQASDISREGGESWRQKKGGSISRVCGNGEEGWPIGSSFSSLIQAVPPTLLSNFIDGCRMIWIRSSLV